MSKVTIIGLGYVGCVTAACLARDGHEVTGVDLDPRKAESVGRGEAPLEEPGLGKLLSAAVSAGRLRTCTSISEGVATSEAAMICVGTPAGRDDALDLRHLSAATEALGTALRGRNEPFTVIVRSTVPPGTAEELVIPNLRRTSRRAIGARGIVVLTLPEFLREASAIDDMDDPPFVVVGAPSPAPATAHRLIGELFGVFASRTHWVSYRTAELLKTVCNAFHAAKVVFANEVGALCRAVGVDGGELMRVFSEDRKLNISPAYLRPGLPFGGSCLPKDLRALLHMARQHGVEAPQLGATLRSNDLHIERMMHLIEDSGCARIGLDGLAFKPGTDDLRSSPLVAIAERLLGRGYDLRIYDPLVWSSPARASGHLRHLLQLLVETPEQLVRHAQLLVCGRTSSDIVQHARQIGAQPLIVDLGRPPDRRWRPTDATSAVPGRAHA